MNFIADKFKNERFKAIAFLTIAALIWSAGGLIIKSVEYHIMTMMGIRNLFAALIMLVIIKKPDMKFNKYKLFAIASYSATVITFFYANRLTTAATAILLQFTAPIYVALLSYLLLKERITRLDWITIFIVIGGMILFFIDDISEGGLLGNVLAIVSGLCLAFSALLLRRQKDESPFSIMFWGNVLLAIIGLPFMTVSMPPDAGSYFYLLFLAVFQVVLPYMLYGLAIKHVTALELVLIPVIEPLLNPVWVFLALGELPGPWSFVGGFIVLAAIVGRSVIIVRTK